MYPFSLLLLNVWCSTAQHGMCKDQTRYSRTSLAPYDILDHPPRLTETAEPLIVEAANSTIVEPLFTSGNGGDDEPGRILEL